MRAERKGGRHVVDDFCDGDNVSYVNPVLTRKRERLALLDGPKDLRNASGHCEHPGGRRSVFSNRLLDPVIQPHEIAS